MRRLLFFLFIKFQLVGNALSFDIQPSACYLDLNDMRKLNKTELDPTITITLDATQILQQIHSCEDLAAVSKRGFITKTDISNFELRLQQLEHSLFKIFKKSSLSNHRSLREEIEHLVREQTL